MCCCKRGSLNEKKRRRRRRVRISRVREERKRRLTSSFQGFPLVEFSSRNSVEDSEARKSKTRDQRLREDQRRERKTNEPRLSCSQYFTFSGVMKSRATLIQSESCENTDFDQMKLKRRRAGLRMKSLRCRPEEERQKGNDQRRARL